MEPLQASSSVRGLRWRTPGSAGQSRGPKVTLSLPRIAEELTSS
jgi:hypothetical protein